MKKFKIKLHTKIFLGLILGVIAGLLFGDKILFEGEATFPGSLKLDMDDSGTPELPVTISSYGSAEFPRLSSNRIPNKGRQRLPPREIRSQVGVDSISVWTAGS